MNEVISSSQEEGQGKIPEMLSKQTGFEGWIQVHYVKWWTGRRAFEEKRAKCSKARMWERSPYIQEDYVELLYAY